MTNDKIAQCAMVPTRKMWNARDTLDVECNVVEDVVQRLRGQSCNIEQVEYTKEVVDVINWNMNKGLNYGKTLRLPTCPCMS